MASLAPKAVQQRLFDQQDHRRQHHAGAHQQGKGVAHDDPGLFQVAPAPLNGEQGRTSHAEQVGKGRHNGDDGEGQSQSCQGVAGGVGQAANVHPVHHAVQHVDQLGYRHGHGQAQDVPRHAAFGKVVGLGGCHGVVIGPFWGGLDAAPFFSFYKNLTKLARVGAFPLAA